MTRRPIPMPAWRSVEAAAREVERDVAAMGDAELAGMILAGLRVLGARSDPKAATRLALGLAIRASGKVTAP